MEKKYPVLKCDEKLWNEIKPILKNFGIIDFNNIDDGSDKNDFQFKTYPYLVSNYGNYYIDKFLIGNIDNPHIDEFNTLRYLVDTKEEFLSAVAKLLGKEYPIKEEIKQFNGVIKYPYIKCTQKLYDKIKNILEIVGYNTICVDKITETANELVIDYANNFGDVANLLEDCANSTNRYRCSNIREFLTKACELKGFEVSYVDFVCDGDAENHYFDYRITKENTNEIYITENLIIESSKANKKESFDILNDKQKIDETLEPIAEWDFSKAKGNVIPNNVKKKFKKKKERYVVSYDPTIGESNTVVATIPAKGNDFNKDKGSDLDIDKNKDIKKIDIVNKLKHCKKGTKLYSPIFGEVEFDGIENNAIYVNTTVNDDEKVRMPFESNGQFYSCYPNGECLLFPSKDNRDWNSFRVLEEGHRVMVSDNANSWSLRLYVADNKTICFNPAHDVDTMHWQYIVPIEDFDFTAEDITINKEKSIV